MGNKMPQPGQYKRSVIRIEDVRLRTLDRPVKRVSCWLSQDRTLECMRPA